MHIDDLIAKYLEQRDGMPDHEQQALSEALRADAALQSRFLDLIWMDELLSRSCQDTRRDFSARVMRPITRRGDTTRFVRKVQRTAHFTQWRGVYAMAAGLTLAVLGWLTLAGPLARSAMTLTAEGGVVLKRNGEEVAINSGISLCLGDRIETADGTATVRYPDGSRLRLDQDVSLLIGEQDGSKVVALEHGRVRADVAHQPEGKPFRFTSPRAQATVLGTVLTFQASSLSTRLEVEQGQVRFLSGGHNILVPAGFTADSADIPLAAKTSRMTPPSLRYPEIQLRPEHGELVGDDWRLVADPLASTGTAFESPTANHFWQIVEIPSYIEFRFEADGGVPYNIWGRGRGMAPRDLQYFELWKTDAVGLAPLDGTFNVADRYFGGPGHPAVNAYMLDWYTAHEGYWWIGGNYDEDVSGELDGPVTITFGKTGMQTLRMYAMESPLRMDTIWLSTSQKTRPLASQFGQ